MADNALLRRLETYYDAVPRGRADPQEIGPFTLFVARSGWPYYARPRLGDDAGATAGCDTAPIHSPSTGHFGVHRVRSGRRT